MKPKIIVVCGPTSSGKSDAAIEIAKEFDGEIISADSRQIYKHMNIGTGKVIRDVHAQISNSKSQIPNQEEYFFSEGIRHHLIDVAEPMEDFNISHFKKEAEKAIKDILSRKKIPIVCGGTGFWISALIDNTALPEVKPDELLRSMLRNKPVEELFSELEKLDPERAANIDAKNPARLIRAIEIAKALGKVPSKTSTFERQSSGKYDFLQIGINVPREILNAKIKKRLDDRFKIGMIKEVENLHKNKVSWEWLEKIGLEYRWISRFLQGKILEEEMREKLFFDSIHYAKRQMTWLKKDKQIFWINNPKEIESIVKTFLEK